MPLAGCRRRSTNQYRIKPFEHSPHAVWMVPEIGTVGLTEAEAAKESPGGIATTVMNGKLQELLTQIAHAE